MIAHVAAQFSKLFDTALPAGFLLLPVIFFSGCGGPEKDLPPVPGSFTTYEQLETLRDAPPEQANETPEEAETLTEYEKLEMRLEQEQQERQARLQAAAAIAEQERQTSGLAERIRQRSAQQEQEQEPPPRVRPLPQTPPPSPARTRDRGNPAPPTMGPTAEEIARAREIKANQPTYQRSDLFSNQQNIMVLQNKTEQTLLDRYGAPDSVFTYPDPRQFYQLWKHPGHRPPEVGRFARVKQYVYEQDAVRVYFYMERRDSGDWEIITVIREIPPGR